MVCYADQQKGGVMPEEANIEQLRVKVQEALESASGLRYSANISTENEIYNSGRCDAFEDVIGFLEKITGAERKGQ